MRARGFTIIEVLIAAGIASVIFFVGFYAISTTINLSRETTQRIRDTENARLFFMMIERDFASAAPGPGNIRKIREEQATDAPYIHNPATSPSPLVVTEKTPPLGGSPSKYNSDIIQFYCRPDESHSLPDVPGSAARDEMLFVRYYRNGGDNTYTMCRKVVVYDPNMTGVVVLPDCDPTVSPTSLTNTTDNSFALFDNVSKFTVLFQQWDSFNKKFIREGQSGFQWALCDSVIVTVVFSNEFGLKGLTAQKTGSLSASELEEIKNNTYRSFSKVLPIPASFKQ